MLIVAVPAFALIDILIKVFTFSFKKNIFNKVKIILTFVKFEQLKKINKKVGKSLKLQGKWRICEAKSAKTVNNEV